MGFETVIGPGLFIPGHWIEDLKRQASSEAPLPRLVRAIKPRDKPEVSACNVSVRVGKVRVVRRVQRFGAKLKLDLLRDRERAEDTEISLEKPWTTEVISAGTSEPLRRTWIPARIDSNTDIYRSVRRWIEVQTGCAPSLGSDTNATWD